MFEGHTAPSALACKQRARVRPPGRAATLTPLRGCRAPPAGDSAAAADGPRGAGDPGGAGAAAGRAAEPGQVVQDAPAALLPARDGALGVSERGRCHAVGVVPPDVWWVGGQRAELFERCQAHAGNR